MLKMLDSIVILSQLNFEVRASTMNVGVQIKKYRQYYQYSQENLVEKVYVSRQTISNWENGRSYPDIQTLLMLSVLFDVSLDQLVKGDVDIMKEEISRQKSAMKRWAWVMVLSFLATALLIGPTLNNESYIWLIPSLSLLFLGVFASIKIETIKKRYNLDNYERIVAFSEGQPTDIINSKQSWKDWASIIGVPLVFILLMLLSAYISSLF
jgi:transcriptional regulator with XRE-family HTH domain